MREIEGICKLRTLWKREILSSVESLLERLQLRAGVDGTRLARLLPLRVDVHLAAFDDLGLRSVVVHEVLS